MRPPTLRLLVPVAVVGLTVATAGSARMAADDVIALARFHDQVGTTTEKTGFQIEVGVQSTSGVLQAIVVRTTLGPGVRWGNDPPDPTEDCTTANPAVCTTTMRANEVGTIERGWAWDVVVDGPGTYEITAAVEPEQSDPDLSNNTATFRFLVVAPSGGGSGGGGTGGGSGGGGGNAASVLASAVKLAPAKPKAGSTVVASVRVTRGGSSVRPTRVACSASIGGVKVKGGAKAKSGAASCLFKTPKSGKGKTMLGSVSFKAGGQSFTKRFSARLV
jgi:hypothetical protein